MDNLVRGPDTQRMRPGGHGNKTIRLGPRFFFSVFFFSSFFFGLDGFVGLSVRRRRRRRRRSSHCSLFHPCFHLQPLKPNRQHRSSWRKHAHCSNEKSKPLIHAIRLGTFLVSPTPVVVL